MSNNSDGHDTESQGESTAEDDRSILNRRDVMAGLGAGAMGGIAGCGGDGGGTPTATPTPTDTPMGGDDTPTDTPMGGGDEETETEDTSGEDTATPGGADRKVYEKTYVSNGGYSPPPTDAHFYPFNGTSQLGNWSFLSENTVKKSTIDYQWKQPMLESREARPGILDWTYHDDWYFWDGHNIDADSWMFYWELSDFVAGGEDLNARPEVVERQKTGDYSIRMALQDTWVEEHALEVVHRDYGMFFQWGNTDYFGPLMERFRDASSYEAIENIRNEISEKTETDPSPFYYNAFEITDATADKYIAKLRTREHLDSKGLDHQIPHFVENINYDTYELRTGGGGEAVNENFEAGKTPFRGPTDQEFDFETQTINFVRPAGMGTFYLNPNRPPTSSVHFRRAWAYMTDRKTLSGDDPWKRDVAPFYAPRQNAEFISEDVLNAMETYGGDQVMMDKAEQEMIEGGFIRDSNGNWLYKEGEQAGQPMEFDLRHYSWVSMEGQTKQFNAAMDDFGIKTSFRVGDTGALWGGLASGDYIADFTYYQSFSRIQGLQNIFAEGASANGGGVLNMGPTVEAPPVGDANNWDDARTYETYPMMDRLLVVQDQEVLQEITDTLSWVFNQTVPHQPVYFTQRGHTWDTERWDVTFPDERPDWWLGLPQRYAWDRGMVSWKDADISTDTSTETTDSG